jgi:hypothetical protein
VLSIDLGETNTKKEKKINKLRTNDVSYGYRKKTTSKILLPFPTFQINILTMKKGKESKQTNYSLWFKIYVNRQFRTPDEQTF